MSTRFIPLVPESSNGQAVAASAAPLPLVPSPAAQPASARATPSMPRVETRREGERVTAIIIACRCGERIELACEP